jgi:hypothetical protein
MNPTCTVWCWYAPMCATACYVTQPHQLAVRNMANMPFSTIYATCLSIATSDTKGGRRHLIGCGINQIPTTYTISISACIWLFISHHCVLNIAV